MTEAERYEAFVNGLKEKYPEMYADVNCGIYIGEGWFEIINKMSGLMYQHIKWNNDTRERLLKDNPHDLKIPDAMEYPAVRQIKEKFGGLRFYYDGGDSYIDGVSDMAEVWANSTCEKCGERGTRRSGGWIRTLCDKHEEEHQLVKLGNQNA